MTTTSVARWQSVLIWLALAFYIQARICQLYADRLPSIFIVLLHVVPPAVFAAVHGSILYRRGGMLAFAAICLGVGGLSESLSLRTGIPFGHYYFTSVMGPKIFDLPVLLVLAYLGIGYCSWVLSLLILRYRDVPLTGARIVVLPALASFIMLAWDLSMEADWSTVDKAWIWRDGGVFFGVPVSNFLGWYLTAYIFYQTFALYCAKWQALRPKLPRSYWAAAILLYAVCAAGNLLILKPPMAPPVVIDASGKQWITMHVLIAGALISLLVMGSLAVAAWLGLNSLESAEARSQQQRLATCSDPT